MQKQEQWTQQHNYNKSRGLQEKVKNWREIKHILRIEEVFDCNYSVRRKYKYFLEKGGHI